MPSGGHPQHPPLRERQMPAVRIGEPGSEVLALGVRPAPAAKRVAGSAVAESAAEAAPAPGPGTAEALATHGLDLAQVAHSGRFTAAAGSVLALAVPQRRGGEPKRLLLVGTGDGSHQALRRAGAALARALTGVERADVSVLDRGAEPTSVRALVEGLLLGAYTPPRTGLVTPPGPVGVLTLDVPAEDEATRRAVHEAVSTARAAWLARDLAATPSSVKNPAWVARTAQALAAEVAGISVEVMERQTLERQGFGGLVAVGAGSATPPVLVTVRWEPPSGRSTGRSTGRHVVLVGKGITFDTGGLSIKPGEAMVPMKTDMSGAGVVLATVLAAAREGVPHRVTGVLALAENAVGASSYRPGDVVTTWGGTTVEIANTDAEGRIVLADALAWADATLEPDLLVDVATLTGAASLGLGRRHAALYTADERLADGLLDAAQASGERAWRMPLAEDYLPDVESDVADLRHVTADKNRFGGGGSITAALFLREFVGDRRWAHLDVAGPSRADRDEYEVCKGATGYGARLLLRWLQDWPELDPA